MNLHITKPEDVLSKNSEESSKYAIHRGDTVTFECERCHKEVTLTFLSAAKLSKQTHLLCKSCKTKETNMLKYGVSNPAQSKEIKEKTKQNNLKKYGVEYPTQLESVKEKSRQTNIKKYGVSKPLQSPEVKEKVKNTNLKKYGVECPFQSQEIIDKIKQDSLKKHGTLSPSQTEEAKKRRKETLLEKYGEESIFKTDFFKEKSKHTCQQKYGTDYALQSAEVKNKIKETCLAKYGVDNISSLESTREKVKSTVEDRYGVSCVFKSPEVKEKIKETNIERYGVPYATQSSEVKNSIKETCLKLYGSSSYLASEEGKERSKKTVLEKYGVKNISQSEDVKLRLSLSKFTRDYPIRLRFWKSRNLTPQFEIDSYIKAIKSRGTLEFKCDTCNTIFTVNAFNRYPVCRKCHPYLKSISFEEKEVVDYIKSIYNKEIQENTRSVIPPKELDIFIPEKNLAIEFNGIYWHSKHDKTYHLNKTEECNRLGIRLIHLNEEDWVYKKDICKSIIASSLGVYKERIYARKCVCKEIDSETYRKFLEKNHLNGAINSSFRLGLFYEDRLVQVAGWGKSRFKKDEVELHRMCTLLNTQVIGGFSKLIKHSSLTSFVSYVDRSIYNGDSYFKSGFKLLSSTPPSYRYYNLEGEFHSRFETQKHKLKDLLKDKFDSTLTEEENMLNAGFFKVYDCGNLKMKYEV